MRRLLLSIGVAGVLLALPASAFATPPSATGVTALSPNPTNASTVEFAVVFDQAVTGVDASDFTAVEYLLTGAAVVGVSGSGTSYTVTVSTGTGDGLLRLDVDDDDTIRNAGDEPLAAPFDDGDIYLVDKTRPTVTIAQAEGQADPASVQPLRWTVTFSEPVDDFTLDDVFVEGTTDAVSGAVVAHSTTVYGVELQGLESAATVTLGVDEGAGFDEAGNPSAPPTSTDAEVTFTPPSPLTASASSLDFGSEMFGGPTRTQQLTITNASQETQTRPAGFVMGGDAESFSVRRGTCRTALAPGASCVLDVTFVPTSRTGSLASTLHVTVQRTTVPLQIGLRGVATPKPPPPVVTPPRDLQAPGIALKTTSLRLNRNRTVRIPLFCAEQGTCTLATRLHAGRVTLAKRTATVLGLRDLKVTLRLSRGAARRVQRAGRRGLQTTLRFTATDAHGNFKVFRFAVRVRRV